MRSPTARELARLVRLDREAERSRVGDRVPHASVGDVDRERADAVDLERRVEPVDERTGTFVSSTLSTRPSRHAARTSTTPARRLEAQRRLGLVQLDHPGLEQDGRDADRVRARHRRILGRLHDDVARVAVGARRRHDQVRVHRDRPARLAQQQATQRIVGAQRLHLLEHRRPGGRQNAADDDVPDLPTGVTTDDRDRPARRIARPYRSLFTERRPWLGWSP